MTYYIEIPHPTGHGSTVRPATSLEVSREKAYYRCGKCRHKLVYDKAGFSWDLRYCELCKSFLGCI